MRALRESNHVRLLDRNSFLGNATIRIASRLRGGHRRACAAIFPRSTPRAPFKSDRATRIERGGANRRINRKTLNSVIRIPPLRHYNRRAFNGGGGGGRRPMLRTTESRCRVMPVHAAHPTVSRI